MKKEEKKIMLDSSKKGAESSSSRSDSFSKGINASKLIEM